MNPTLKLLSLPATGDTIILQDLTQYSEYPSYPLLELTLPDKSKYNLQFKPQETNVLRIANVILPDGIYQASYGVAPYEQTTVCYTFLRTYTLECKLNSWLNTINWIQEPLDSPSYQVLSKFSALLLATSSSVQLGDLEKADSYLRVLETLLP